MTLRHLWAFAAAGLLAAGCSSAGAADAGGTSGGGASGSSSGGPTCAGQGCDSDGGCCAGAYCWPFTGSCVPDRICQGAPTSPGQCSCDGILTAPCPAGQSCPAPAHGHDTYCCDNAGTGCTQDTDCCQGLLCLIAGGTCADAGPFGALPVGASCVANGQCVNDLCTGGQCTCWPTGTPFPPQGDLANCCSQVAGLLPDGGQGCG